MRSCGVCQVPTSGPYCSDYCAFLANARAPLTYEDWKRARSWALDRRTAA